MTVLLVLAVWMLLGVLVAALFCALVRGGRCLTTEAQPLADVAVPTQRVDQGERSTAPTG